MSRSGCEEHPLSWSRPSNCQRKLQENLKWPSGGAFATDCCILRAAFWHLARPPLKLSLLSPEPTAPALVNQNAGREARPLGASRRVRSLGASRRVRQCVQCLAAACRYHVIYRPGRRVDGSHAAQAARRRLQGHDCNAPGAGRRRRPKRHEPRLVDGWRGWQQVAVCIHVGGSLRARPNLPAPAPRPGCGAVWDLLLPRGLWSFFDCTPSLVQRKKGIRNQPSLCTVISVEVCHRRRHRRLSLLAHFGDSQSVSQSPALKT